MRAYQRAIFTYAREAQHPALFVDMRLGKTLVTVRRIKSDARGTERNLVVGPYSCLYSWARELALESFPERDVVLMSGTRAQRLEALQRDATWFLVNNETHLSVPEIANMHWNEVVLDESTFVKAPPRTNWSKRYGYRDSASKFYTEGFRTADRRWALTGTPAPESELDYFMQLQWLSHDILPFANYWAYRMYCFTKEKHDWLLNERGKELLGRKLAEHCYFLKRADVKLGGRKVYVKRLVQLSERERKTYRTAQREQVLELDDAVLDVTDHSIASYSWLRQLCGGFVKGQHVSTAKLRELERLLLEELARDQVVVWCDFVDEIIFLADYLTNKGVTIEKIWGDVDTSERFRCLERFHRGDSRVIICQPRTMRHGVDFSNADTMIFYSSPLGAETRQQCEDRCVSVAKGGSTLIIDIVCEQTIEEDIYISHIRKESRATMMRRIAQRLREAA